MMAMRFTDAGGLFDSFIPGFSENKIILPLVLKKNASGANEKNNNILVE
jgi:hypothetical protein